MHGLGSHELVPHPSNPPRSVSSVAVQLAMGRPRELWLEYSVRSAAALLLPKEQEAKRADGLWKATCFELFLKPSESEGYVEFNFSPSFQWAAYGFSGYRSGMVEMPAHDPEISLSIGSDYLHLAIEALPDLPPAALKLGLSAVIEEIDGTKSYWALAHAPGPPDFHHPDCFALQLPAPEAV